MLSRKEIAMRAGVSKTTVTRVLAGDKTVLPVNREKIERIVAESGYTRNVLAANLAKNKRSTAIAMLVPDMTNYYYMQMFNEMVSCARKYGHTISIYSISTETLDQVIDEVVSYRVCGIINFGLDSISEESLKKVQSADIRIVYPGWPEAEKYRFVIHYDAAIREAMGLLREGGCRSICFHFGTKRKLFQDGRIKAFLRYGREYGFDVSEKDIFFGEYTDRSAVEEGYATAKKLFGDGKRYDAMFCLNDMMAYGAIRAIKECGLRVPADVSVVGFDNVLLDQYFTPAISTIGIPLAEEADGYVRYCAGMGEESQREVEAVFFNRDSIRKACALDSGSRGK